MTNNPYELAPGQVLFKTKNKGRYCTVTTLNDNDGGFTDEDVRDFIQFSHQGLFKKLKGLPIPSDHVEEPADLGYAHLTAAESVLTMSASMQLPSGDARRGQQTRKTKVYLDRTLESQHKRHIESFVLSK
jgi:hypothetical protein